MTDGNKVGAEVVAQANDDSIGNTEPAVVRGAVIAIVGALSALLVVSGVLSEEQRAVLQENAGNIAVAVMVILPIVQAVWTRFAVYAPRTAAKIAVENAALSQEATLRGTASAVPTLMTPP